MKFLVPDWPAPANVHALMTTRHGGVSLPPYDSFNLATHVGDQLSSVLANRQQLATIAQLPSEPCWINQVHGVRVLDVDHESFTPLVDADGSLTRQTGRVLAVLTADCLPVFVTNITGNFIMVLHAGWRGVADGIIAHAVKQSGLAPETLMAWIGPGIGRTAFEVDELVRGEFLTQKTALPEHFEMKNDGKYLGDLSAMAQWQCRQLGLHWVGASQACTYQDREDFYSYRREGVTGRMASLMWLADAPSV